MKITRNLPEDLKRAIEREARRTSRSEAEVVTSSLREVLIGSPPKPRGVLFYGNEPIAERVDELLEGFGR